MEFIPIYQPTIDDAEKKNVLECIESTWISSKGKFVDKFEKDFSKKTNIKNSLTVSNGTVALHLALLALDIKKGDEVIVPSFTYIASVNCISYTGAKPVFADSLRSSWQIDPDSIRKKITSKTKAILPVHLYGHPCDMEQIMKIADEYNLFVIEDCAEAFGSKYDSIHVGNFGDISTFSFFGNKTITTGEGGMVSTNNDELHEKARHLKGQGLATNREYWHDIIGYNYRMTNICAAIGVAQLEKSDELIKKKLDIVKRYKTFLKDTPLEFQKDEPNVFNTYWIFSILTNSENERDNLRDYLKKNNIETRPTFFPVHTMPMYYENEKLPIAQEIASRGINLPSYPDLTDEQIIYITKKIKEFY